MIRKVRLEQHIPRDFDVDVDFGLQVVSVSLY
jgi:hypothetical protein